MAITQPRVAWAASGTWTADAGDNWSSSARWSGGTVADGVDATADFSTVNITAARNLTNDASRTIGHLRFGDTTASHDWTLSGAANTLTLDVSSGAPLIFVTNRTATISTIVGGNDGVEKGGAGTLTLSGANTFSGGLTINGGIVSVANDGNLGNSANGITFTGGGQLTASAAFSSARGITINAGVMATNNTTGNLTLNGVVGGGGNLVKIGAGTLILAGTNSYAGTTSATAGELRADDGVGLPSGNLTLNAGVWESGASITRAIGTGSNQVQLPGGASGFATVAAAIDVNLGGAAGTVTWGGTGFLPSSLVLNTANSTAKLNFKNALALNSAAARTITVTASESELDAILSNTLAGGLTKNGAGTLILSATNTYTGTTTASAGNLRGEHGVGLGSGNLTLSGGVWESPVSITRALGTGAGMVQLTAAAAGFSAVQSAIDVNLGGASAPLTWGSGSFAPSSSLTLNSANAAAKLTFKHAINLNTASTTVRTITVNADTAEIEGAISNTGTVPGTGLTKNGGGTLVLSGSSAYSGVTTVSAGMLRITHTNALGTAAGGTTVSAGATLELAGGLALAEPLTLANTATLRLAAGSTTCNGTITATTTPTIYAETGSTLTLNGSSNSIVTGAMRFDGPGDIVIATPTATAATLLTKNGTGTLTVGATYGTTGATTVNAGTVLLGANDVLGSGVLTLAGGTLDLNGNTDTVGAITLTAGSIVNGALVQGAAAYTLSSGTLGAAITGSGTMNKGTSGTVVLSGDNAAYTGNITITATTGGVLELQSNTAAGPGGAGTLTVNAGTALQVRGGALTIPAEGGVFTLSSTGIANDGGLRNMAGDNTYQGAITVGNTVRINSDSGTLTIAPAAGVSLTCAAARTLSFGGAGNVTLAGGIGGVFASTVTKDGAGTLTLGGTSAYTGATTVNDGTLLVNGSLAAASAVAVNSGAILGGTGTCPGAVTVSAGGRLAAGAGGMGTLTAGTLNLTSGSEAAFELDATPANDQVAVTTSGGLTLNGCGILLVAAGSTNAWTVNGTYALFQYSGALGGAGLAGLSVTNPQAGKAYTFGTAGGWVTVNISASGGAPEVTNGSGVVGVTAHAAELGGYLVSTGGLATTVTVYWGATDGGTVAGQWDHANALGQRGVGGFSTATGWLAANSTYYYRCHASNSGGSDWADATASFATLTEGDTAATINTNIHNGVAENSASPSVVFINDAVGYQFYVDGPAGAGGKVAYSKTTDGGRTWGAAVAVGSGDDQDNGSVAVWYDGWTPGATGTKIHLAHIGELTDLLSYNALDTTTDTAGAWVTVEDGTLWTSGSLAPPSITKTSDGTLFVWAAGTFDAAVKGIIERSSDGVSWTRDTPTAANDDNDFGQLLPLPGGDVLFILQDVTSNLVVSTVWDAATTNWDASPAAIDTWTENANYDSAWGASLDPRNGDAYLVGHNNPAVATGDLKAYRFNAATRAWSALADVADDAAMLIPTATLVIDASSGDLYAVYGRNNAAIGTNPTGVNIHYRRSTDGGASWGAQSAALNTSAGDFRAVRGNLASAERLYAAWVEFDNDDVLGATVRDTSPAMLRIDNVTVTEGNAGTTNAVFTVSLPQTCPAAVTFDFGTADGSATAGSDYTARSGTLIIPSGRTSTQIVVQVSGDATPEADETYAVALSNAVNAAIDVDENPGTGTIVGDDVPGISIGDVTVTEGNAGTTNAIFSVSLSNVGVADITVPFSTTNGTALAGSDYVATNGVLTILAGNLSGVISVSVNGDVVDEAATPETFLVNLGTPVNGALLDGQGQGSITDDDAAALSIGDVSVTEDSGSGSGTTNASFTVTLSCPSYTTVSVQFASSNATATAGSDYVATNGTLTLTAGQTSGTITAVVNGDSTTESDETFQVLLSNPVNASVADGAGLGTILNNDGAAATCKINAFANFTTAGVMLQVPTGFTPSQIGSAQLYEVRTNGLRRLQDPVPIGPNSTSYATFTNYAASAFDLEPGTVYTFKGVLLSTNAVVIATNSVTVTTRVDRVIGTPVANLYVATNGLDSNAGTLALPKRTLAGAFAAAAAGTHIHMRGGIYREGTVFAPSVGTAANPLVVKAYSNEVPILDGSTESLMKSGWVDDGGGYYHHTGVSTMPWLLAWRNRTTGVTYRSYPVSTLTQLNNKMSGAYTFASHGITGAHTVSGTTLYIWCPDFNLTNDVDIHVSQRDTGIEQDLDNWITYSGLTFQFYHGKGVYVNQSDDVWFTGCTFLYNNVPIGLKRASERLLVENCTFIDDCTRWGFLPKGADGYDYSGYIETGIVYVYTPYDGRGMVVRNNTIDGLFDSMHLCPDTAPVNATMTSESDFCNNTVIKACDDFIETDGYPVNVRILDNVMENSLSGISIAQGTVGPLYCVRNVLTHGTTTATTYDGFEGYPVKSNGGVKYTGDETGWVYFYHNTAWTPATTAGFRVQYANWRKLFLANNIWYGVNRGWYVWQSYVDPIQMDNDFIWHESGPFFVLSSTTYTTKANATNALPWLMSSREQNPNLFDPANGNYHLSAGSPAIDAGVILAGVNDEDFANVAPDCGAYESSILSTVRVTVATSPVTNLAVLVNGVSNTAPHVVMCESNSVLTVSVTSPQYASATVRHAYASWSDGGAQTHSVTANVDKTVTASFTTEYLLTAAAGANGSVAPTSGWYTVGSSAVVTATPSAGYHFVAWTGDVPVGSTNSNPLNLTMSQARSVTASFAINQYTLTYLAGAGGSISGATVQVVNHGASGSTVTAVASNGYAFLSWSDGGMANPRTDVNVTSNITVTANFTSETTTHTLTYTAGVNGAISGTSPQVVLDGANGTAVTAVPDTGYHFVDWSDSSTSNPRQDMNVTTDITVTANFTTNFTVVRYVKADATGANNGTSWAHAFTQLANALAVATAGNEIWVAGGTYKPGAAASSTFTLKANVPVYGGFAGTESSLAQRDWAANIASLSGEIGTSTNTDNVNRLVTAVAGSTLDGFRLEATYGTATAHGALVANGVGPVTVRHCTFVNNAISAGDGGGCIYYNNSGTNSLTVEACAFISNVSVGTALNGAVVLAGTGNQYATVKNCLFSGNTWSGSAAGGSSTLASIRGSSSTPIIANCTFANNVGGGGGTGGVIGVGTAGGTTASMKLRNCIIRGSGIQLRMPSVGSAAYKNCAVPSATLSSWASVSGVLTDEGGHLFSNPLLADEDGADNVVGTVDDSLNLQSGSPCRDAGTTTDAPTADFVGVSRPQPVGGSIDIGAYEYPVSVGNVDVTLATSPSGLLVVADSVTNTAPQVNAWASNSVHAIGTPSPQNGATGTRYVFASWSDSGAQGHNVTADTTKIVTASFGTEYLLSASAGANGSVAPTTGWYAAGSGAVVTSTPSAGYHFAGWTGDVPPANTNDNPLTLTMSQARTITGNFALNQYTLTYTAGANGAISGTSPQTVNHGANGSAVTAVPDAGYAFLSWSDSATNNPRTDVNVTSSASVTASFALEGPGYWVTEYYLTSNMFTNVDYVVTLDHNLAEDYFILVRGSKVNNAASQPDNDYARVVAVPGGRGNLPDSGATNAIWLSRRVADFTWEGVVTVVECMNRDNPAGFRLVDARSVAMTNGQTSGSATSAVWSNMNRVVPFGGYRGGGAEFDVDTTAAGQGVGTHVRLYPSGSNTVNWTRNAAGETLQAASMTIFVIEWGSEWTVQRANVSGAAGGNGANATTEYTAATITSVPRDRTWVWGTGTRADGGVGDCAEACLVTLGDGVTQNASETKVAVGSEYADAYNFDVYAMTHTNLVVDYRFKVDGDSTIVDLGVTVDTFSNSYARFGWVYNGCNGTDNTHPRSRFWARFTSNNTVTISRGYSGAAFPAWLQAVDFSALDE